MKSLPTLPTVLKWKPLSNFYVVHIKILQEDPIVPDWAFKYCPYWDFIAMNVHLELRDVLALFFIKSYWPHVERLL